MKKYLWLVIVVALLGLLFAWRLCSGKDKDAQQGGGPQAVAVETAPVEVMDLEDSATFSGNLRAANSYILAPKVAGQLVQLNVNIGDTVSRGQVIAVLDDVIFRQEFNKAKANLEQAASAMAEAEKALEQSRTLLAKSYIPQSEFDRVNAQYISEQAKYQVALAGKNAAETQLANTRVKADWSGGGSARVIGERFADAGQLLNSGSPLVSVLDIGTLVAEIDVIESDYTRVKVGQPASISSDSWPEEEFNGRIARVAPMLKEESRQARVEIEVANPGLKLKPGMYARARITWQIKPQATAVPSAAIYKHKGEEGVFLVDKASSKVSFIPVEKGIVTTKYVEILSPALSGEVVTLGQDQLDDGREIILPGAEKKGKAKP
ncbi:MAG: efflux RND transporter periplasmic adaptor subunit [Candidatus Cloacimonetes bacterium]|nr:efflux RND transporter periplasmic adaptor subunit [Candidatus Cloacimonadota bacterium]MDY0366759.1 efflux RND transporter periplasmic adaptor subunit [Candidatus Syntrophosphaera sp.]